MLYGSLRCQRQRGFFALVVVSLLLACLGVAVCATRSAAAAGTVTVEKNLCYQSSGGSCVDGANHEFDAFLPGSATQATPGVILIHGGGFTSGSKSGLDAIASDLAQDGMAAFSINYRLDSSTVVGFPMESQDVMAAISYIRANASSFNVIPTRLASFGSSAGATLAVYTATEAVKSDPSAEVVADVGWSGGYDFTVGTSGAVDPTQLRNAENYLGCSDPTNPTCAATAKAASAVSLVQSGDPATLLANSTDYKAGCEIVSPSQAQEMTADLTNATVPVQLDLNSECAHATAYTNIELGPTTAFLESHLFAPTTTIVLPSANAILSGSQYLDATASPGLSKVQYELTGQGLTNNVVASGTPTLYGWLAAWNTTNVPNGSYTLRSVATYQNGVVAQGGVTATSTGVTITVDNPAPTTTVVLPSNGATVSGSQYLDATASSGVTSVTYELTGGALSDSVIATGTPTLYGWLTAWNTTTVPDGTYTLTTSTSYPGGVTGTSSGITVTIAN
jgi:acetyl esterase/lipase